MRHLILGDAKGFLTMFIRKKRHRSGNIGVIVVEKIGGKMKELETIGVAYSEDEVETLVNEAKEWISKEESRRHPQPDLYGEDREACDREPKKSAAFCPIKELERMLKVSEIKMSVDKVLALAKTITTIQIKLPLNKDVYTQTMLMARHQKIAKLFDEDFWVTQ